MTEQTYCDRLVQDTPFLTGPGRLSEQQVDRIILQLNRYYPQILSNKDAEKVPRGGPEAALLPPPFWAGESRRQDSSEVEACLLGVPLDPEHQLSEPQCLHMSSGGAGGNHRRQHMTARHKPGRRSRGRYLDPATVRFFRSPKASLRVRLCDLLGHLQRSGERDCQEFYRALYIHAQPLHSRLPSRHALQDSDCTELDSGAASGELSDRGPVAFLACLGLAAGLALLLYCCPPDPKVLPGARRVLGFSPVIIDRHVSRFLLTFLTDDLGGL
ncbi:caspase recruitment domain-containing protein 19 isoform X1 [Equus asinus]|uniref:caspase recruitment domain-containing protein 19 isoform X1 n=2 Tax=Equus asinus TaxID=9793 RepID=UPI0038F60CF9